MKQTRDHSIIYGTAAGFLLFVLLAGWLFTHIAWDDPVAAPMAHLFPAGTEIIEERDSHGGFHGEGVAFLSAQVPPKASEDFAFLLRERKFSDAAIPEEFQSQLRIDPETCIAAEHPNSLWRLQDESPEGSGGRFTNYTLQLYDLDTGIYYYIEFDS